MAKYQILRARMETDRMPASVAAFVQRWAEWKERNALLDFTDLIETCLLEVSKAPGDPEVMFVDEAQDLDLLEMSLIRKWGARAGGLHIVGDPDQAIFSWRGADAGAFTASEIPEEKPAGSGPVLPGARGGPRPGRPLDLPDRGPGTGGVPPPRPRGRG